MGGNIKRRLRFTATQIVSFLNEYEVKVRIINGVTGFQRAKNAGNSATVGASQYSVSHCIPSSVLELLNIANAS